MWRKLGTFENAQAITAEKAVFNAVIVLHLNPLPCSETVQRAMDLLQERHPLLRAGIVRRHGQRRFTHGTHGIQIRSVLDCREDAWEPEVERELNTPFDAGADPLVRMVLVGSGSEGDEGTVILSFHHAIIDAESGMNLVHEFLDACSTTSPDNSSLTRFQIPMKAPDSDFPASYRFPRGSVRLVGFILRSMWDEISFQFKCVRKNPPPAEGSGRIIHFEMDESAGLSLLRSCRRAGISLNSLAGAAMLMAVHRELYQGRPGRLRHITFSNLRPYLSPPRDESRLGSFFSMLRLTLPVNPEQTLVELAQILQNRLESSLRRGDRFNMARMSKTMMSALFRMRRLRMASTALSYSVPPVLTRNSESPQLRKMHVFVSNFPLGPEYTAQVRFFNNRLCWDILYLDCDLTEEQALSIAGRIRELLADSLNGNMKNG